MRWVWIDRFEEFQSGKFARALKNVSLAEEYLHDHFPGFPVMPASLMLEGLAQTGGLLVGETSAFEEKVILAKIPKATFHGWVQPGDQIVYETRIVDVRPEGAVVEGIARVGDRIVAEAEIVYAHLDDGARGKTLFEPKNFVFTMRLLGVFDVGKAGDGAPLSPPNLKGLQQAARGSPLASRGD